MNRIIGIRVQEVTDAQIEQIRQAAPGFEILDMRGEHTDAQIAQCEIIYGGVAPERLAHAGKLKWLHTQYAGVEAYCRPGVNLPEYLTNAAGAYGTAISEHLLTMALMLCRQMPGYAHNMPGRKWRYLGKVRSIYGSSVAVAGLGDIGGSFAQKMHALGARVHAVVRRERERLPAYISGACLSSDAAGTDKMLAGADIIALCMPHTAETLKFLDRARIAKLKPGAIILNVGRGSAIDEDALADALESGHLGGAGLDVTAVEPLAESSRLWACPNTIITPHMSGYGSLDSIGDLIFGKFMRCLSDYLAGRPLPVVDREAGY